MPLALRVGLVTLGLNYFQRTSIDFAVQCESPGGWEGPCDECYDQFGKSACSSREVLQPTTDFARDDLVQVQLTPAEVKLPVLMEVSDIQGADLASDRICPPVPQNTSWTPPNHQGMFATLTRTDDADKLYYLGIFEETPEQQQFNWIFIVLIGIVVVLVFAVVAMAYRVLKPDPTELEDDEDVVE